MELTIYYDLSLRQKIEMKHVLSCIIGCAFILSSFSQNQKTSSFEKGIDSFLSSLYNYDFVAAENNLRIIQQSENRLAADLCHINYCWWRIISGDNRKAFQDDTMHRLDSIILEIQSMDDELENNELIFLATSALSYKLRIALMQEDNIQALNAIHKLAYYIEILDKRLDSYTLFRLPVAVYHYVMESVGIKYPFLKVAFIFYPKANKEKGMHLLNRNLESDNILLRTESAYFLMRYYLDVEKNYKEAAIYADKLVAEYPNNMIYQYFKLQILEMGTKAQGNRLDDYRSLLGKRIRENFSLNSTQRNHTRKLLKLPEQTCPDCDH